jgi:hypothetical protein
MTPQECFNTLVLGLIAGKHPHEALGYPACPIMWKALRGRSIPGCDDLIGEVEYIHCHVKPAHWEKALLKLARKRELTFPKTGVE